ncbi:hypothetical protein AWN76_015690 [Rhodothermaceae bacterium RA]|nr:hypothetical protein AWN76_015690 [Rhodothermaceae bacterium RA]
MKAIRFRIDEGMVDAFAALTGDQSSLHVDEGFARRAPFRRRVVHGMLPVLYLSRWVSGAPVALAVRFLKPVFPGDMLELKGSEENASVEGARAYRFDITRVESGETVTTGTVQLVPFQGETWKSEAELADAHSIVPERLQERVAVLEELEKGEEATFRVIVSREHRAALRALLVRGLAYGVAESPEDEPLPAPSWLYAAATSTYVGMSMPGRYATYTELISTWGTPRVDDEEGALFTGKVAFLSASTRMAVGRFRLETPRGVEVGQGTVKVRVGEPPRAMPSMPEVQARGMDLGLQGRVVLVTGASRGIGETIAKLFAAHGARVVVNYHRGKGDAERVVDEIAAAGGQAMPIGADVTDAVAVRRLIEETEHAFGPVEVLVNNAAGDYDATDFGHLTWSDVQRDLDVILKGAFICCQAVLPGMVRAGFGRIVNLSTHTVEVPPFGHTAYVVAKSALVGLTRSLAVEYAGRGITVNAVMPGMVETDLTANVSRLSRETHRREIPMQRLASPLDVARAVVYLASDWGAYATGQQLPLTGGLPPFF